MCVCERSWWFQLRKFGVNDVPPAIPSPSTETPLLIGSRNGRLVHMPQEIRCARLAKDWSRFQFLRVELSALGRSLGLPLIHPPAPPILVPNLTAAVKMHIGIIIKDLVRQTEWPRWEREALICNIRIVRTVPRTPVKTFQIFANDSPRTATVIRRPMACGTLVASGYVSMNISP